MQGTVAKADFRQSNRMLPGRGSFARKLAAAFILVIGADIIFWQNTWFGSGFGLFATMLLGIILVARGGLLKHHVALIASALSALYAAALWYDPGFIALILFCISIMIVSLLPGAAKGGDGWQWFQRLTFTIFLAAFRPLLDLVRWSRIKSKLRTRGVTLGGIKFPQLQTIILPILGSALFIGLFAIANPVLGNLLSNLHLPSPDFESVARVIFWTFFFWMAWGLLRPRMLRSVAGTFDGRGDAKIPGVTLQSLTLSLGLFNLIFAVQNVMDIAYLGGFVALPEGMTLAQYAHRGAYPLIVTALLAGLFTLITLRPGSESARNKRIRRLLVLWIAQNIFLVGSSVERTLDYIRIFSLTQLRIAALAWMVLVAIGLVLICWRMLSNKNASWLINANLIAAGVMLTIFTFVDSAAVAAQWNVRHAREVGGEGTELDLCYLNGLNDSALLPLVELEQRGGLNPVFLERVRIVRQGIQSGVAYHQANDQWTLRNAGRLAKAEVAVGKVAKNFSASNYRCNGAPMPFSTSQSDVLPIEPVSGEAAESSLPPSPPSPAQASVKK